MRTLATQRRRLLADGRVSFSGTPEPLRHADDRLDASIHYSANGAITLHIDCGVVMVALSRDQVRVLRLVREVFGEADFLVAASLAAASLAVSTKSDGLERCLTLFEERAREEDRRLESGASRTRAETQTLMSW